MKKILKYSTALAASALLTASVAVADTGGYVKIKGFDSQFHKFGLHKGPNCGQNNVLKTSDDSKCRLASRIKDNGFVDDGPPRDNVLRWNDDDGEGLVVGADFGFFRLEVEGQYNDGAITSWRGHTATDGQVHQGKLFANVLVEPFDLLELMGEFGGIEPLVKYNPAHYGISPYAMYGYGVWGALVENLSYTRECRTGGVGTIEGTTCDERGAYGGGATAAVNAGAGVNIGLDQLAQGLSDFSGATLPEYFKLPIELQFGYHWQVSLDEVLFEDDPNEDLGIDDGGWTYAVGLKW